MENLSLDGVERKVDTCGYVMAHVLKNNFDTMETNVLYRSQKR